MSEPRRHHFLPVNYLAGFASPNTGSLSVISVNGRRWAANPRSVAFENDLYRVEGIEGIEPNDFEKEFGNLEGAYASVLRSIVQHRELPDGASTEFRVLLDFISLILARGPHLRSRVHDKVMELVEAADRDMRSNPEDFTELVREARNAGAEISDDPESVEQMRQLEIGTHFKVHVPNTFFMQTLFRAINFIRPWLKTRCWRLLVAVDAEYVTSDRPVGITLRDPELREFGKPDFRSPDSDLTFPLNRNLLLLGEGSPLDRNCTPNILDRRGVASMNSRTISMGNRFVCWSGGDLVWLTNAGAIGDAEQLHEAFRNLPS